jgi:hypothetical protein
MSLIDDLKAELAGASPEDREAVATALGFSVEAPLTDLPAPGDDAVCLNCGLERRYNKERTPRIAAAADDGSDSGWGVGDSPTGWIYCKRCKERTRWGPRPAGGIPLPGESADPELQSGCTHRNEVGVLTMSRTSTFHREAASGFVMGPDGVPIPRHRDKPGKAQFACQQCAMEFHGKRNLETEKGWVPDMDRPVTPDVLLVPGDGMFNDNAIDLATPGNITVIRPELMPAAEQIAKIDPTVFEGPPTAGAWVDEDPEEAHAREQAEALQEIRGRYHLPLTAYDLVEIDGVCSYSIETPAGVQHYRAIEPEVIE